MAKKACHMFGSATQVGLTQALEANQIMRLLIAIAALILAAPAVAFAGEFVAIGHVTEISLLPEGTDRCPALCPTPSRTLPDGQQMICMSNSCGCGEAHIRIDRVLIGAKAPTVVIKRRLGEWCAPEFPLSGSPVLIRLTDDGDPAWSLLESDESGGYEFDPNDFSRIGSVDVSKLKTNEGLASLLELERELGL